MTYKHKAHSPGRLIPRLYIKADGTQKEKPLDGKKDSEPQQPTIHVRLS